MVMLTPAEKVVTIFGEAAADWNSSRAISLRIPFGHFVDGISYDTYHGGIIYAAQLRHESRQCGEEFGSRQ